MKALEDNEVVILDSHDTCFVTDFCRRCGLPAHIYRYDNILCAASGNLVAISHIRALARMSQVTNSYPDDTLTFPQCD